MSDSRRRSTRRGKIKSIYALNDLVQIPHNSTTVVGRLSYKIMEEPSVRWLVSFDDIPNRKDEEIAEEALGPVIGRVPIVTPITNNNPSLHPVTTSTNNDIAVGIGIGIGDTTPTTTTNSKDTTITTRSLGRKSNPESSNSSSSAEDNATKTSINKRRKTEKEDATSTHQPSLQSVVEKQQRSNIVVPKEKSTNGISELEQIKTTSPTSKSKATDREQRSRRRRGSSFDEMSSPQQYVASTTGTATAAAATKRCAVSTANSSTNAGSASSSLKNKRSSAQGSSSSNNNKTKNAKGEYASRNKKGKFGNNGGVSKSNNAKKDVVKVQLLTGTLYLYRGGANRHVEFIMNK